jgi:magnesium transporter
VSIGAVLIATFGAIGEPAHGLSELLQLFERAEFLVWIFATAVLVGGAAVGSRILKTWVNTPRTRLLRGMSYGFVSGILSAHSLLLAKSAVELVVRTIADHVNQFNRWQSWAILLGLIGLALGQLYYLHRGLKLCSTSILYPFVFCIYNIIAILDGLIYFNQASQLSVTHILLVSYLFADN